ncbi:MAG TPA: FmdB family zinc ribbon protein [Myxococcales bacterium]|jgi:putative FmdB family regulatory protein|nr:FmdB family zinc ribbon protein [Myxococcales bacterium]
MPDYEFICQSCHKPFTAHQSVQEHEGQMPQCPQCKSNQAVQQAMSHFNTRTSKKSS